MLTGCVRVSYIMLAINIHYVLIPTLGAYCEVEVNTYVYVYIYIIYIYIYIQSNSVITS